MLDALEQNENKNLDTTRFFNFGKGSVFSENTHIDLMDICFSSFPEYL